ncbi:unnamed protein product, partial [marine sediment metagenome]
VRDEIFAMLKLISPATAITPVNVVYHFSFANTDNLLSPIYF